MSKRYGTVAVVLGGDLDDSTYAACQKADYCIAADKAAIKLLNHSYTPHAAIGDFDSVTEDELVQIQKLIPNVCIFPKDKDKTDGELALQVAVQYSPKQIHIYGATGGRIDHMLGTAFLMSQIHKKGVDIVMSDPHNRIRIVTKKYTLAFDKNFPYFSVIPYTESALVTLKGCRYPLTKVHLFRSQTRGISNSITEHSAEIIVYDGEVFCIESRD